MANERAMTGIERHFLDEDIARVRTYLDLGPKEVPDSWIEELIVRNPGAGAKGIACRIKRLRIITGRSTDGG